MSRLGLELWCHGVAKDGHRPDEWEDAAAFSVRTRRFAVADGATTAFRASAWSDLLTSGWLEDGFDIDSDGQWDDWLAVRAARWHAQLDTVEATPYFVRAAAARGSFATFLGVEVQSSADPSWRAISVGDPCLFHTRGDRLVGSFPITRSAEFGSHPELVHTGSNGSPPSSPGLRRSGGELRDGDVLLLATDALAEWVLRTAEVDAGVWSLLRRIDTDGFEQLVGQLRLDRQLVNDDTTLLRCSVDGLGRVR